MSPMLFYLRTFTFILHHFVLIIINTFSHILVCMFDKFIKKIILVLHSNQKIFFYPQKLEVKTLKRKNTLMRVICKHHWLNYFGLGYLSQPYFLKSVRMTLTLPKWGLGSPPGFLKLQSSIVGVTTPRIKVLFIPLESYQSVDVENGLAWAIWTSKAQVMAKRKAENQTGSLISDH
jgi:hypothetical protein